MAARALIRGRGSQFIDSFDEILRTEGLKILRTPVRTPVANTFAERWIGTLPVDFLTAPSSGTNTSSNASSLVDYTAHYDDHRLHRSLDQRPPRPADLAEATRPGPRILRTTRCDGLITEYRDAA